MLVKSSVQLFALFLIIITATLTGWLAAFSFRFTPADFPELSIDPVLKLVFKIVVHLVGVAS